MKEHTKVMYFHTKGISHFCGVRDVSILTVEVRAINSWRHLMEWGCIDKWKENLDRLRYLSSHRSKLLFRSMATYEW